MRDGLQVEAPVGAGLGEAELAPADVAQREVLLRDLADVLDQLDRGLLLALPPQLGHSQLEVGVGVEARDAVGGEQVAPAVVVEVAEQDRPSPVGAGDAGELGRLLEAAVSGVEQQRVAHDLRRVAVHEHWALLVHVAHEHLRLLMCGHAHVGDD